MVEWFHGVLVVVGLGRDVQLAGSSIRVVRATRQFIHTQGWIQPSCKKGQEKQGVVRLAKQRKSERRHILNLPLLPSTHVEKEVTRWMDRDGCQHSFHFSLEWLFDILLTMAALGRGMEW